MFTLNVTFCPAFQMPSGMRLVSRKKWFELQETRTRDMPVMNSMTAVKPRIVRS
jgi:hypothetical protein